MTGRLATLVFVVSAVAVLTGTMQGNAVPYLVWNASACVPIGLYRVTSLRHRRRRDSRLVTPPEPLANFVADGGYLPRGTLSIKSVLAAPGQRVCRNGQLIGIDGTEIGTALERDRRGRAVPNWHGCRLIVGDEVFLMNQGEPASLVVGTSVRSRCLRSLG
jgi:type IV secretory pathway protease TraF